MDFRSVIRSIPDYPKTGMSIFRDITTLLGHPRAFRCVVDELVQPYAGVRIDKVAGIEARGFILGGPPWRINCPVGLCAGTQERKAALAGDWGGLRVWNMAPTGSRFTRMPLRTAITSCLSTISSRQGELLRRDQAS